MIEEILGVLFLVVVASVGAASKSGMFETDPVTQAQNDYANDRITIDELERRLDVHACSEAEKIRNTVEAIGGVGPNKSYTIAQHFDTYAGFKRADYEDLIAIYGVGEALASEIDKQILNDD